jgi:uncharacterized membrane protein
VVQGLTHQDAFFGLYYLLLRPWLLLGDGALWVRLPSVLFAAAAASCCAGW